MVELQVLEDQLLRAVKAGGDEWQPRARLAQRIGRKRLNLADLVILQLLAEKGLIEARRVDTYAPSKVREEYRLRQ